MLHLRPSHLVNGPALNQRCASILKSPTQSVSDIKYIGGMEARTHGDIKAGDTQNSDKYIPLPVPLLPEVIPRSKDTCARSHA